MDDIDATRSAIARLRGDTGGSDPWTETCGKTACRGGFVWHDADGNRFDVTVNLSSPAPRTKAQHDVRRIADTWQLIMLGDDSVHSTDPKAWRHAIECREISGTKVGRP